MSDKYKPKLTIPAQIKYMKDHCGIKFDLCSEEEAEEFLNKSTYFFKVKSFAKNFNKDAATEKYIDLDFAYLVELSKLDMHIRKKILSITLDIEHFLKVDLIRHLSENFSEDGYKIIDEFFIEKPEVKSRLENKMHYSMCSDLARKLHVEGYALWNIVELLSFGDFIDLYKFYAKKYGWNRNKITSLLFSAKCIRNAAAHNNCLLNSLKTPYNHNTSITHQLDSFVSRIPSLKKSKSKQKKLSNPAIHDFVATLLLFERIVTSQKTKEYTYQELYDLFHKRMTKKKNFFIKNEAIVSSYIFVLKIVDFLYSETYNKDVEQKSV